MNSNAEKSIKDINTNVIHNWYESAKNFIDEWARKINLTGAQVMEFLSYLGIGFVVGFLFKKFSSHALIAIGVFILGVLGLETLGILTIDWTQVNNLTGIGPSDTIGSLLSNYFMWLKEHFGVVLSAFIGFLIGYKVG
jgi:uncharacterized membrane protein (Fun14 family)